MPDTMRQTTSLVHKIGIALLETNAGLSSESSDSLIGTGAREESAIPREQSGVQSRCKFKQLKSLQKSKRPRPKFGRSKSLTRFCTRIGNLLALFTSTVIICSLELEAHESSYDTTIKILSTMSNEDYTFVKNGSFLQIDAGREWPFNSKREISFRFRTKSPHGLLIYQTFDHNKLYREEDQETSEIIPQTKTKSAQVDPNLGTKVSSTIGEQTRGEINDGGRSEISNYEFIRRRRQFKQSLEHTQQQSAANEAAPSIRQIHRIDSKIARNSDNLNEPLSQLGSNTITAAASEKLVNSLFSSSHISTISGNDPSRVTLLQPSMRDKTVLVSASTTSGISGRDSMPVGRNRLLGGIVSGINQGDRAVRVNYGVRSKTESNGGSPVISSSTINSLTASLYELYIKLENGRLKIVYEFGSRLNQTYCGKSLNDDRWHRVDLKVDPEINQMILTLDQMINVEIALGQMIHEDDGSRRNDLVFTNSILYLGGLNNNTSIAKNVRQRLYMAQFIGCMGQVMLRTDQSTESSLQPVPFDKMVLVKRGCRSLCDTDNYCLHNSLCVNYYTHTRCDCFGTNFEDDYCWQDKLTTLTMLGYSSIVYRIYNWRDRHHSHNNRFSMQFKTLARDSVLFFAYGDLTAQQTTRNPISFSQASSSILPNIGFSLAQMNISSLPTIHRPQGHQMPSNHNYLALSLANGSLVVEISFGDQPIILSNLLYDKINNLTGQSPMERDSLGDTRVSQAILSDGEWHNVTLIHTGKQLSLHLDDHFVTHTVLSKNNHLYFDPSIYVGGAPNFLLNETKALVKPINLRYKFVGCMRSVYFNQQNILLDLKRGAQMVEYRDLLGRPLLDRCEVMKPNSLPLTLRSGKSYLTFQLSPGPQLSALHKQNRTDMINLTSNNATGDKTKSHQNLDPVGLVNSGKKLTWIEFEYKTQLTKHFLAGGHLRDLSYHDLGGFWTLQAREECQLYLTISSGLTFDPEQVLVLGANQKRCSPGEWYKVSISIMSGDKALNITRTSVNDGRLSSNYTDHGSYVLGSSVELLHQVQLGGDLAKFGESSSIPFSGCIRHIIINGNLFDSRDFVTTATSISTSANANINPQNFTQQGQIIQAPQYDVISSKISQGYVTIDSCQLVNPCLTLNPCKNGGVCKVNELGEPDCDCSKTGYTGRRCHFSIYKKSCQDLYLSGQRKSSFYLIDLDRNGPLKPVRVRCNMDMGFSHIETSLAHNLPAEFLVKRSPSMDLFLDITYLAFFHMYDHEGFYLHDDSDSSSRNMQDQMLRALIGQSTVCKQHFRYECRSAPINLGNRTWFEAPFPRRHRIVSLDGSGIGKCPCASSEKRCLDPRRNCNCDSGESSWSDDSHDLFGHEQVGITRIVLLQQNEDDFPAVDNHIDPIKQDLGNVESQSRISLGDLKCYGTAEHGNQHEITFKTSDAYIEVPGWRKGDISFNFRTASNPPAIILYQLATSRNHGYFRLTLITDNRLLFEFIVNRRPRRLSLTASHRLNNGEWQQVFIEYDPVNIRLTVNGDSILVDLDPNDHLGTFEGPMYIGGAPSKYLIGDLSRRNGFTGCFKGLHINGRSIDLNDYLSSTMPTVISGCRPSCKKNLCQNGGKCIEYWGSYECECSNPIAHSGGNCEINLNLNSITFMTPESHYVESTEDGLTYPPYLIKSILLNIRTYQETSLVLYAHDQFNNFIQLHKNGSSLVLTFNSNMTIITTRVPIDDETTSPAQLDVKNKVASTPIIQTLSLPSVDQNLDQAGQNNATNLDKTGSNQTTNQTQKQTTATPSQMNMHNLTTLDNYSIRVSNTSGSGQPIQIKIERQRLRTTFYVNNNFVIIEKPLVLLTDYTQYPWINPELELVRPVRPKIANSKAISRIFLANINEHFSTRLPGFTGCVQGFSIDNQLFDFNRAHLTGEMKGDYKIGCKMHCDSFPCKNQGTCVENWIEDKIQCKCDTTSYVGRLCDEDIAAIFNGLSSHFIYNLSKRLRHEYKSSARPAQVGPPTSPKSSDNYAKTNVTNKSDFQSTANIPSKASNLFEEKRINFLEVSLAFSSEMIPTEFSESPNVQVIVWMTNANSKRYFFLGLTSDGGLLIQEDYGNSMSLSRLIKKPEHPFNDGYRHMVKYSRYNQTIQITVDHQAYLPTMSIVASSQINKFSRESLIVIGTPNHHPASRSASIIDERLASTHQRQEGRQQVVEDEYVNFSGCISNLIVQVDELTIEPFSEAFGQNVEAISVNVTTDQLITEVESRSVGSLMAQTNRRLEVESELQLSKSSRPLKPVEDFMPISLVKTDDLLPGLRLLKLVDKVSGQDAKDELEAMITSDVHQGRCAPFRRVENSNEKRSVNEPKFTQLMDLRPAHMYPPRIKLFESSQVVAIRSVNKQSKGVLFYLSLAFLAMVTSSTIVYAYILQMRYRSEKFRCETPFFNNKRDETSVGTPVIELESD